MQASRHMLGCRRSQARSVGSEKAEQEGVG